MSERWGLLVAAAWVTSAVLAVFSVFVPWDWLFIAMLTPVFVLSAALFAFALCWMWVEAIKAVRA